jgi:hypothetical protein
MLSVDCYSLALDCTFAETGMNHGSAIETKPKQQNARGEGNGFGHERGWADFILSWPAMVVIFMHRRKIRPCNAVQVLP